jgi:hypothetical protein
MRYVELLERAGRGCTCLTRASDAPVEAWGKCELCITYVRYEAKFRELAGMGLLELDVSGYYRPNRMGGVPGKMGYRLTSEGRQALAGRGELVLFLEAEQ